MGYLYVRSTDGNNSDNGTTWALAKADISGAAGIDAAGDIICLSQAHAESTAGPVTCTWAGTAAAPVTIIGVNDGAAPPTAESGTASVTTTASGVLTMNGNVNVRGITFNLGTSTGSPVHSLGDSGASNYQKYANCDFKLLTTGVSARLDMGAGGTAAMSLIRWDNCGLSLGASGQALSPSGTHFHWRGGSILSGSTALTSGLFRAPGYKSKRGATVLMEGIDLSLLGVASFVFDAAATAVGSGILRNCKLPAWTTGGLATGAFEPGQRFELWNCDSADTNYRLWIETVAGSIRDETTIKLTGGATDGTTAFSHKFATTSSASQGHPLVGPEQYIGNATVGSSVTVEAEVVTDGVTLKTSECWLEVQYLGTSGVPLAVIADDGETNLLTALAGGASNQTTSTETWTTTGISSPTKQVLSVTFTPQEVGTIIARVVVAKPSTTVYADLPRKV